MTKANLILEISAAGLPLKDSEVAVKAVFGEILQTMRSGKKFRIRRLGSFYTRQRKARAGAPEKWIAGFKPSKALNALINSKSLK